MVDNGWFKSWESQRDSVNTTTGYPSWRSWREIILDPPGSKMDSWLVVTG